MNSVTLKAGAKRELLFDKPASDLFDKFCTCLKRTQNGLDRLIEQVLQVIDKFLKRALQDFYLVLLIEPYISQ